MTNPTLGETLRAVLATGLAAAPDSPSLRPDLPDELAARIEAEPAIQHALNGEPWYRSRVTIGALVSLGSLVAGALIGRDVAADDQTAIADAVMAMGSLAGALLTLYGRWWAVRPIGRSP